MRLLLCFLGSIAQLGVCGCALGPPGPPTGVIVSENPVLLPINDRDVMWNTLVDVVDDYFTIDREEPVRQFGNELTEGRIDTFPETGSTLFEPWRRDSAK